MSQKWGYSVAAMNDLLLTLFSKYSELLKQRFSDDFLEIVQTDDYMPMPINSIEEYEKVVTVSWYSPEKTKEELTYASSIKDESFQVITLTRPQISMRVAILSDVPIVLHRYPQLPQPNLPIQRRLFPKVEHHR
jgi:hypothetical protein